MRAYVVCTLVTNYTFWRAMNSHSAPEKTLVARECKASCFPLLCTFLSSNWPWIEYVISHKIDSGESAVPFPFPLLSIMRLHHSKWPNIKWRNNKHKNVYDDGQCRKGFFLSILMPLTGAVDSFIHVYCCRETNELSRKTFNCWAKQKIDTRGIDAKF